MLYHFDEVSDGKPRVNFVHDGARLHYALPVALQRAGILGTMFTDWFVRQNSVHEKFARSVRFVSPQVGQRLLDRRCAELYDDRVKSNSWLALRQQIAIFRGGACSSLLSEQSFKRFGSWVRRQGWRGANSVMGFVTNIDPELCAAARSDGLLVVVDQIIAPAAVQAEEHARREQLWPAWCDREGLGAFEHWQNIEERTWSSAHHVTCASRYVRDGLIQQGVSPDKVSVVPYPVDAGSFPFVDRQGRKEPVSVGFLGTITLRKGMPTFLEVARRLNGKNAEFTMVGPIVADRDMIEKCKGLTKLVGPVPRSHVRRWLDHFDVFLFPSTCEGSAGAVMEAMATGLPVITTPNSGTVVRDGIDGFVVDWCDTDKFVASVSRLVEDRDLRLKMGRSARQRVQCFNLDNYSGRLYRLFCGLLSGRKE